MQPTPTTPEATQPPPTVNTSLEIPVTAKAGPDSPVEVTLQLLSYVEDPDLKAQMVRAAAEYQLERMYHARDLRTAQTLQETGQFDDLKKLSREQGTALALTKLQFGRQAGLTALESMRSVVLIQGRATFENSVVAEKLVDAGFTWDCEFTYSEATRGKPGQECTGCTLWLKRWNPATQTYQPMLDRHNEQISVSFGKADADRIEVYEGQSKIPLSSKFNYKSWAQDMYYWRCIARVKKYYAPNVMKGSGMKVEAYDAPIDGTVEVIGPVVDNEPAAEERPATLLDRVKAVTQDNSPAPAGQEA